MKRLIFLSMLVVCLTASVSMADVFSFTNPQLADMHFRYDNPVGSTEFPAFLVDNTTIPNPYDFPNMNNVEFRVDFYGVPGQNDPFTQAAVGYEAGPWDDPIDGYNNYWNDLSDYTEWTQSFHLFEPSEPGSTMMVNLCMNTGWVPSDGDIYYETGWTEIAYCENNWLTLDFSDVTSYEWDPTTSSNIVTPNDSVANLNHVTNIGVQLAINLPEWVIEDTDEYMQRIVCIDTVPVPGAILLGILGLSVAGIKLRKFA